MQSNDFDTDFASVLAKLDALSPENYGQTRNYINGSVSRLSPYISRGVISTKYVLNNLTASGFELKRIEKFVQELTWRDYWQRVWMAQGDAINSDLRNEQLEVSNHQMPQSIIDGKTGIECVDNAVAEFYRTGYIHNHVRMYIAMLATNIGQSHWKIPARWMYYHLLDGDWASNALSWQWVAGTNSSKKYIANQANINKYCRSEQRNTFLDKTYEELYTSGIPAELGELVTPELRTELPEPQSFELDNTKGTALYNWYNLDPNWRKEEDLNRVLLLEPEIFERYPISAKSVSFMLGLSKNIPGTQVFTGNYESFVQLKQPSRLIFKEHPLNAHYRGIEDQRDWMFKEDNYYKSFFGYWKKCQKELAA